jgi:DNA-binding transcriptional MerR regulator
MMDRYVMHVSDVARALGLSPDRVRQLDEELRPIRRPNRRRYYDPALVAEVLRARAARYGS